MKNFKKIFFVVLLSMCLLVLVACRDKSTDIPDGNNGEEDVDIFLTKDIGLTQIAIIGTSSDYNESTNIVIPEYINGKKVVEIDSGAFDGLTLLEFVTLPSGLQYLQDDVFSNDDNLKEINISDSKLFKSVDGVLYYSSYTGIGEIVYSYLKAYPAGKTEREFTVPDEVDTLLENSFKNAKNLLSIDLNNTTLIARGAFEGCCNLEELSGGENLTHLYGKGFCDTKWFLNLASTTRIGNVLIKYFGNETKPDLKGLTAIGAKAFADTSLEEVDLRDVGEIEYKAFSDCKKLSVIKTDNSTFSIDESAFSGCDAIKAVVFEAFNPPTIMRFDWLKNIFSDYKIYVPYDTAPVYRLNLVEYADKIESPEVTVEFVVDGTTVQIKKYHYGEIVKDIPKEINGRAVVWSDSEGNTFNDGCVFWTWGSITLNGSVDL